MNFIVDHSGRVFKKPTIKDVCANQTAAGQNRFCV